MSELTSTLEQELKISGEEERGVLVFIPQAATMDQEKVTELPNTSHFFSDTKWL